MKRGNLISGIFLLLLAGAGLDRFVRLSTGILFLPACPRSYYGASYSPYAG